MTNEVQALQGYTPGPWSASFGNIYSSDETGSIVATTEGFRHAPRPRAEVEANARLIAAAPELLNACQLAVMMLGIEAQIHRENQAPKKAEAVEKAIEVIQAAIDKATQ